jgi:hypothetical protein
MLAFAKVDVIDSSEAELAWGLGGTTGVEPRRVEEKELFGSSEKAAVLGRKFLAFCVVAVVVSMARKLEKSRVALFTNAGG